MSIKSIVASVAIAASLTVAPSALAQRRGGMNRRPPRPEKPAKPVKTPIDEFEKMAPEERQKALDRLPPKQRQQVEERLQKFNQLPPAQQQTLKNMYNRLNELPAARQEVVRGSMNKFFQSPADRQQVMREELRGMAPLTGDEREARMSTPEFKSKFNASEQEIVRNMSDLLPPR